MKPNPLKIIILTCCLIAQGCSVLPSHCEANSSPSRQAAADNATEGDGTFGNTNGIGILSKQNGELKHEKVIRKKNLQLESDANADIAKETAALNKKADLLKNQTTARAKVNKAEHELETKEKETDKHRIERSDTHHSEKSEDAAEDIGDEMDDAERYLEEYGSISISVPLMSKLGENFNFDLNRGATNYFSDAKNQIQGAAAAFRQTVQSLSISAQGQFDPTVAAAYASQLGNYFSSLQRYHTKQNLMDQAASEQLQANMALANTNTDPAAKYAATAQALQAYEQQYSAPSNAPAYPTDESSTNLPALGALPGRPNATNVLNGQQFLPFQGLLAGLNLQPTVSDRTALMQAAGDVATESIFRHFMGSTNTGAETAEDNVFFGFSTVSVNPGWRTKQGWAAEAIMTAEIGYTKSRPSVATKVFEVVTNPVMRAQFYLTYGDVFPNKDEFALRIANDYRADTNSSSFDDFIRNRIYVFTNSIPTYQTNYSITAVTTNQQVFRIDLPFEDLQEIAYNMGMPIYPFLLAPSTNYLIYTNVFETTNINAFFEGAKKRYINRNPNPPIENTTSLDSNVDNFISLLKTNNPVVLLNLGENETGHTPTDYQSAIKNFSLSTNNDGLITSFEILTNYLKVTNSIPPQFSMTTNLPDPKGVPVTIISPLVDADVEDFSSSSRSQTEFALALSFALRYAGLGAQANAFEQFVKNNQFDIRTRNALVAVNAYSGTDGKFGFQVGPRLQALDNPTKKSSKSSQLLDRQSFPALLILRLGQVDLGPILLKEGTNGQLKVMEPQLKFTQMRRWTPLNHSFSRDGLFYRWFQPVYWANSPVSEGLRLRAATKLYSAKNNLTNVALSTTASNAVVKRIDNLESQIVGGEGATLLDANDVIPVKTSAPPVFAAITNILPAEIVLDGNSKAISVAFLGTGLNQVQTKSASSNVFALVVPATPDSPQLDTNTFSMQQLGQMLYFTTAIDAQSISRSNSFALIFKLQTTNMPPQIVYSPPVTVRFAGPRTATKNPTVSLTVSTNLVSNGTNLSGNAINYTFTASTNVTDNTMAVARELIKADIEKDKSENGQSSNTVFSVLVNENRQITGSSNNAARPRKAAIKLEQ